MEEQIRRSWCRWRGDAAAEDPKSLSRDKLHLARESWPTTGEPRLEKGIRKSDWGRQVDRNP
ncbi:hypothetical protein A6X21_07545 [Planctopirus hydrillae]|uniref:Uncharacterized protein n=1 Tax=Planctopirus hydrillae TaxID=1841610 RepID=A0A1C3E907_9PLAN|nr:hypothetical protein A6X21_07545 [Planctopirus hydrillae]